ncbi:MAG: ChbG/HpnK family deacetylase [Bifidobacteriaceae bacterium]|jgi:predicted glycoside hydrolase/deacetylase ChbG (UPF0249 family)|nr:ChbG/HpnK family deacetylase [Bifidobacteriaceae bacterium]
MGKKLIIRADDLGYSRGVNYGILDSVNDGLIRTVGIMTNMDATEHGWRLIEKLDLCLGQHTNICIGRPIVDPALIPSITTSDGNFKSSRTYRSATQDFVVLDEVLLEIEAQYQRFLELVGRKPDYFEGHAIQSDNFFRGLEIVAKRHNLDYCPMQLDGTPWRFRNSLAYYQMEAWEPDYDPKAAILRAAQAHKDACDIYVCHPGYLDAYILEKSTMTKARALEVEAVRDPDLKLQLQKMGVKLVTFNDL